MKIDITPYNLDKEKRKHLPLFYGFLTHNKMIAREMEEAMFFNSEKYHGNHGYSRSNLLISKIIDFSKIDDTQITK